MQVDEKAEEAPPRRRRSGGLGSGGLGSGPLGSQESSGQLPAPANLQQEMDAAAARDGRLAEAEVVKVELELPQGVGADLLLAKSEDDEEWETVGASPKVVIMDAFCITWYYRQQGAHQSAAELAEG